MLSPPPEKEGRGGRGRWFFFFFFFPFLFDSISHGRLEVCLSEAEKGGVKLRVRIAVRKLIFFSFGRDEKSWVGDGRGLGRGGMGNGEGEMGRTERQKRT